MKRTTWLAPLAATTLLLAATLGACAAQHYCVTDVQCRTGEVCDPTTNQCINNPCHGAPAGTFVRCDGGDAGDPSVAWLCDDTGRPSPHTCGPMGCEPAVGGCRLCEPRTLACYGDTLVACGEAGEVVEAHECPYGCDADAPACQDCRPYTTQCHDDDLVRCGAGGQVVTREVCENGCNDDQAACNPCTPGLGFCHSDGIQLVQCDSVGQPGLATPCDHGCNAQRAQCNDCTPNQPQCDGTYLVTCTADGLVAQSDLCVHGCNDQRAQCNDCTPNQPQCDGDHLVTCDPTGQVGTTTACPLGCNHGAVPARCYTFTPTALEESDLHAGLSDLVITTQITIDTDAQTIDGAPPPSSRVATQPDNGPDLFVVHYRDISILSTATLTVTGSRGLALVASGRLDVWGLIDGAATRGLAGPGGRDTFDPPLPSPTSDGAAGTPHADCGSEATGGGGAAHCAAGGSGGFTISPNHPGGAGGAAVPITPSPLPTPTPAPWTPLRGGSAGGRSGFGWYVGGAGGGVIALVAAQEISIACTTSPGVTPTCGHLDVSGGGGTGYGAGAGAAGTILLEAPTILLSGTIHAVGGGGACGGIPWPGTDGAQGGQGCNSPDLNGHGGNGGLAENRLWSPTGGSGMAVFCNDPTSAGGGGASAGRILIRTAPAALTVAPEAVLRAAPCGPSIEDCFGELVGE